MMTFNNRTPSEEEINKLPIYDITKDEIWNPKNYIEDSQEATFDDQDTDDDHEDVVEDHHTYTFTTQVEEKLPCDTSTRPTPDQAVSLPPKSAKRINRTCCSFRH